MIKRVKRSEMKMPGKDTRARWGGKREEKSRKQENDAIKEYSLGLQRDTLYLIRRGDREEERGTLREEKPEEERRRRRKTNECYGKRETGEERVKWKGIWEGMLFSFYWGGGEERMMWKKRSGEGCCCIFVNDDLEGKGDVKRSV